MSVGSKRLIRFAAGALALLGSIGSAGAAEVAIETTSGQLYVGEIVDQNTDQVRVRTKVHNIVTVLTLSRKDIVSIKETTLPETWLGGKEDAPADEAPDGAAAASTDGPAYLLVPMRGVIGEDVLADGLESVIAFAKRSGVKHIVLEIDSPGGLASEGRRIGEIMRDARKEVTFTAYVKSALSAAVIPAISSHRIFYEPEAQIGAAVAYRWVPETGAAEVDEKFLSALAATMAAMAESSGLNGDIVRAMVIPRLAVYAWSTAGGEVVVSAESPPAGAKDARTVDDAKGVLTLTARQASDLRFGELVGEAGIDGLGERVDAPGWRLYSNYGETAMRRASSVQEEAQQARDRFESVASTLGALVRRAVSEDPHGRVKLYYEANTGRLTAQSRKDWQAQTDRAIKAWDAVIDAFSELEMLDGKYKRLTRESILESRKDIRKFKDDSRDRQKKLKAERNRSTI